MKEQNLEVVTPENVVRRAYILSAMLAQLQGDMKGRGRGIGRQPYTDIIDKMEEELNHFVYDRRSEFENISQFERDKIVIDANNYPTFHWLWDIRDKPDSDNVFFPIVETDSKIRNFMDKARSCVVCYYGNSDVALSRFNDLLIIAASFTADVLNNQLDEHIHSSSSNEEFSEIFRAKHLKVIFAIRTICIIYRDAVLAVEQKDILKPFSKRKLSE